MGTEVLRPQDFFYDRYRLSSPAFHRRKTYFTNGNGFGNQRPNISSGYRKPVHRHDRSDQKKKTHPQKSEQQLPLPRRSSSAPPPPPQLQKPEQPLQQQQQLLHHPRRSSSAPPPPHSNPLFPRRSSSTNEFQNNLPRVDTILRRGQSLDSIDVKRDISSKTSRELVNKKYIDEGADDDDDDVYAGSAFFVSPSPSSLPLPSFFNTNNNSYSNMMMMNMNSHIIITNQDEFHDSATRDLRRLLRLE